jgi:hypothetical protein
MRNRRDPTVQISADRVMRLNGYWGGVIESQESIVLIDTPIKMPCAYASETVVMIIMETFASSLHH